MSVRLTLSCVPDPEAAENTVEIDEMCADEVVYQNVRVYQIGAHETEASNGHE